MTWSFNLENINLASFPSKLMELANSYKFVPQWELSITQFFQDHGLCV